MDFRKHRTRWACCDLSETFIGAQHCSNSGVVLDRFHVVEALNEAVDGCSESRRGFRRRASGPCSSRWPTTSGGSGAPFEILYHVGESFYDKSLESAAR